MQIEYTNNGQEPSLVSSTDQLPQLQSITDMDENFRNNIRQYGKKPILPIPIVKINSKIELKIEDFLEKSRKAQKNKIIRV